jgi:hypothetical protein
MIATVALVELVGYVVLLLWGMHMVQSGIVRVFSTAPVDKSGDIPNRMRSVTSSNNGFWHLPN